MAVAQESEFLAVNQKIRVRIPAVTPFHNARDAEIVEAAACKPALTRCESGRALHFGAIVQQQDDAMALRRSGCDSPWLHHLEGHNVSGLSRPPAGRPNPFLLLGGRQQSAPFGSARHSGQHRGARPFQIPPKRW